MIALCPVPAWVASMTNSVQKEKMKATDGRVQSVTESKFFYPSALVISSRGESDIVLDRSDGRVAHDQALWLGGSREDDGR